jgi:tetratricopeptide (TPR) repeat protein
MAARSVIASQAWNEARAPDKKPYLDLFLSYPNALYAAGIGVAERGDYTAANNLADQILSLRAPALRAKLPSWAQRMDAMGKALKGASAWRSGKTDMARSLFKEAIDDSVALFGDPDAADQSLPDPIKPVRELYGEMLLSAGNAAAAAIQFSDVLRRFPRRPATVLDQARALKANGDRKDAACHYAELAAIWHDADADLPGLAEARREAVGATGCAKQQD